MQVGSSQVARASGGLDVLQERRTQIRRRSTLLRRSECTPVAPQRYYIECCPERVLNGDVGSVVGVGAGGAAKCGTGQAPCRRHWAGVRGLQSSAFHCSGGSGICVPSQPRRGSFRVGVGRH